MKLDIIIAEKTSKNVFCSAQKKGFDCVKAYNALIFSADGKKLRNIYALNFGCGIKGEYIWLEQAITSD